MSKYESHKRKGAVALGYNPEKDRSPKIIAKGYGDIAEKIIRKAEENEIIVKQDPALFESLAVLEPGDEIPLKLYRVVAELLVYIYKINGNLSNKIYK